MISEVTGVASSKIADLASNGQITFDILTRAFKKATKEGGMFANGMDKLSLTLTGVFSNLKDSIDISLGQLGTELVKIFDLKNLVVSLSDAITNLAEKFNKLSPRTKKIIGYAILLAGVLAPVIIVVGQLAIGLAGIVMIFGMILSPIGLAIIAVASLAAGFYYFWDTIKAMGSWLKDKFVSIFDIISSRISKMINGIKKIRNAIKGIFGSDDESSVAAPLKITRQNPVESLFTNSSNINQNQSLTAGGKLDVNINGLPKGSSTQFTPVKQSFMDTGINTVYSGM